MSLHDDLANLAKEIREARAPNACCPEIRIWADGLDEICSALAGSGAAVENLPLLDRVEFALRDAGFDYDLAFKCAWLAENGVDPRTYTPEAAPAQAGVELPELSALRNQLADVKAELSATSDVLYDKTSPHDWGGLSAEIAAKRRENGE